MYGYLAGFSFPKSIFAVFSSNFLFCHHFSKNRKYVNFSKIALFHINCYFRGKGFRRTKNIQKVVHCAHITYIVPIIVKYCGFGEKISEFPFFEIRFKNGK